ncbi:Crp/Fnr family transcriptional regulator [Neorhizobium sp. BT27B]|uniref:Crp/Fnr family transcriptional regulator n=1 Tax=Neorhizobium sp. BT27B TaxID=3142625 RepID=UPI003D26D707
MTRVVDVGHTLVFEGELSSNFIVIIDGIALLAKTLRDGRRQIVGIKFAPGIITPPNVTRPIHISAATKLEICLIPSAIMDEHVRDSSFLATEVIKSICEELEQAREWLLAIGRKSAVERLASFLIFIARWQCGGVKDGFRLELPISRADLSDYLALTIETTSRTLGRLRRMRVIDVENVQTIVVLDAKRLERLSVGPDN